MNPGLGAEDHCLSGATSCFEQLPHGSQFGCERFKPNSPLSKEPTAPPAAVLDYLLHHLQECEGKKAGQLNPYV